jgi:hypothetical protein
MLEVLLSVAVLALCFLAYELSRTRAVLEAFAAATVAGREQREIDDQIRDACPHIFFQRRTDLRKWFAIMERKRQYYEDRKRIADTVDPHSAEESSWFDTYARLARDASTDQKQVLGELAEDTDAFLKRAAEETVLLPAEANFFAFEAWATFIQDGGETAILRIMRDHLRKALESHLEAYARQQQRV